MPTDSGREGEYIFRLVYAQAGCTKPFRRLWTSSLEDKAILEAMNDLKPSSDYDNLFLSASLRDKADWLVGMNLSRLLSVLYKSKLAVGRVKTPTLSMIVERDFEIQNFQKKKQYSVKLETENLTLTSEKLEDKNHAEALAKQVTGKPVTIWEVVTKQKTTNPPLLYDLTTLQRECNRLFHYTAQQTLDIVQSLYENKLVS